MDYYNHVYIQKRVIKRSFLWILDRIVIPVSLGAIFIRLGNFFNSEIVGTETTSSFGIKFLRDKYSANDAMQITQIGDKMKLTILLLQILNLQNI